jgi:phosphoglycolate phosphatase
MRYKAVLFDLDGTLANSLFDLADSVNHVLSAHGFPVHPTESYKYFAGDGIAKMIRRAMPQNEGEKTHKILQDEFMEYYSKHYVDKTVAYNGVNELVSRLKEKGIKVAVVTNKAQEAAEKVVEKLFGNVFDIVMGLRPGIPAKPDPTSVFMVMEELCVKPEECAFVGDTSMDIAVGVNSGAYPIGVLWGFRELEELKEAGAKAFVKNAKELENILL